jgi:hypothetical protein
VRSVIDQLKTITSELEDRATGRPAKRSAAGKKAARTRAKTR